MRQHGIALALIICTATSGSCSSLIERNQSEPKLFPGVRLNASIMGAADSEWNTIETLPFRIVWVTWDMPASLAFDFLLMPIDAVRMWERSRSIARAEERYRRRQPAKMAPATSSLQNGGIRAAPIATRR